MYIKFGNYGQMREVNATPEELEIFEIIRNVNNDVELVRKSDSYVTAMFGESDVARFKYTSRAKWINFPYTAGKIKLYSTEQVRNLTDEIQAAIDHADYINNYNAKEPGSQ